MLVPHLEQYFVLALFSSGAEGGGVTVTAIGFFFLKDDSTTNASAATITTIITIRTQKKGLLVSKMPLPQMLVSVNFKEPAISVSSTRMPVC